MAVRRFRKAKASPSDFMRAFLLRSQDTHVEGYFYHGTKKSNLLSIADGGLRPSDASRWKDIKRRKQVGVYVTREPAFAWVWAGGGPGWDGKALDLKGAVVLRIPEDFARGHCRVQADAMNREDSLVLRDCAIPPEVIDVCYATQDGQISEWVPLQALCEAYRKKFGAAR